MRGPARAAQAHGLPLEIEELLRVDLTPGLLDGEEELSLERRERLELRLQARSVRERRPGDLEPEHHRRDGRPAQIVRRHRPGDLGGGLGEERAQPARVLAVPGAELQQERDGEDELDAAADEPAGEHRAARDERLDCGGQRRKRQHTASLGEPVHELTSGPRQVPRVAELRRCDQRAGDLRRDVDALRGVDVDIQAVDDRGDLPVGERAQQIYQPHRGTGHLGRLVGAGGSGHRRASLRRAARTIFAVIAIPGRRATLEFMLDPWRRGAQMDCAVNVHLGPGRAGSKGRRAPWHDSPMNPPPNPVGGAGSPARRGATARRVIPPGTSGDGAGASS
ncbi:MAG: hypothetical protein FJ104_02765 [Deltaproteobacteria bacterium]|nr:hypothetical protein [Deltaproteobacteria bacterium]